MRDGYIQYLVVVTSISRPFGKKNIARFFSFAAYVCDAGDRPELEGRSRTSSSSLGVVEVGTNTRYTNVCRLNNVDMLFA